MSQLSLGFQALYVCSCSVTLRVQLQCKYASPGCRMNDGHAQCTANTSREPGRVGGTARRLHFSLAIISVTVQLRI